MAVSIDISAFRSSISPEIAIAADQLLADDAVGAVEAVGGGARAVVFAEGTSFQPWVGVIDRAFTGDCDCLDERGDDDFCVHAVAVAFAAFADGVKFSAAGRPNGVDPTEPGRDEFVEAVQGLGTRQLTDLVVEQALRDRLFATVLLAKAGLLPAVDEAAEADFEAVVQEAADTTLGTSWGIPDVEYAGHRLVSEAEILGARPATLDILDLIEQAIEVWDELAGHLIDGYAQSHTDPDEISEPLVTLHRDLCVRLELDSGEIADRLADLLERCVHDVVDPAVYADLVD